MFGKMFGDENDKMHPQDTRNLFIFLILAAIIYFTYDAFVLRPQAAAMKKQQQVEALIQKEEQEAQKAATQQPLRPREQVLAETARASIDNGEIFGSIALKGGRIDDISFHNYYETLARKKQVVLLSPKNTELPRTIAYGWVADGKVAVPDENSLWHPEGNNKLTRETPLTLAWDNGAGLKFENVFSIDDSYMITLTQKVVNNSGAPVTLHPYGAVSQTGLRPDFAPIWIVHEGPIGFIGNELEQVPYLKMRKNTTHEYQGTQGWVGITDKYWLTALVPAQGENVTYRYTYSGVLPKGKDKDTGKYQVDFTGAAVTLDPGKNAESTSYFFAGAKKVVLLDQYEEKLKIPNFDLAVDFGWFWFMTKPFFFMLHLISEFTPNFGVALIILTLVVRSAVFPLTNISYRSFAKMKKVAPEVATLRRICGDDKPKLQAELVKLYEREGVNPMSGCLPMIIQIPIFFSLYKVLVTTIEMRQAPFFGWIHDLSAPDPTSIFNLFGLIPWSPPAFLHIGVWPCLMLTGMLFQRKLNPPPQDAVQRDMANYMPFLMAYMMSKFASGLVIYWTFSAFIGLAQQVIIMRSLNVPIYLFGEREADKTLDKQITKGPGVHPLLEMAEKDVEEAVFGEPDGGNPVTPPKPRRKKKK